MPLPAEVPLVSLIGLDGSSYPTSGMPVPGLSRFCTFQSGVGPSRPYPGGTRTFNVRKEGEITVIEVEGQLIVGNRQELKQKVLEELDGGARNFAIDFDKTGYIDSSGLGVLVSLSKKIREQGGELRLASLNEDLRTLFELTKLDTLFQISESLDGALQGF